MIDRRTFMAMSAIAILTAPLAAEAQQPVRVPRIGFLWPSPPSERQYLLDAFRQGLRELGYIESRNIVVEVRSAEGKYDRLPALATELVHLKVDVIVTTASPATKAAQQATKTIPIVMAVVVDPVATGFIASLARPGGNITGVSIMASDLVGKQLDLLKQVVPIFQVVVLWNPANPGNAPQLREAEVAARKLGVRLKPLEARNPDDLDNAFAAMTKERPSGLIVLVDTMLVGHRARLADLAAKSRIPAIYGLRDHVEAGGLMAYSANLTEMYRRAATYVDRILKGSKPADLPVEQPTKFELVINLKTAKALGLKIPQSILERADEIIQ
jgi:putative ABC transport system substrate-binding protein